MFEQVSDYLESHRDAFLHDLLPFLRIPSISALPEHAGDVRRAAEHLAAELRRVGVENARLNETGGHPIVTGEWLHATGKPTLLIYGHYDVQPVDPLDEWETPPFEPVVRDGLIFGRGSADDKGQVWMHTKVAEAYLHGAGGFPVNVKFLFEGEEESGSENLERFLVENKDRLKADAVLISDTDQLFEDIPALGYGLRGLAYVEVTVEGPAGDQHSGAFGGIIRNPANVLCGMIAKLHDEDGRVTIPGFYDKVRFIEEDERERLKNLPVTEEMMLALTGAPALAGEAGYTAIERLWTRPTLDVNGMISGFTGEGSKTIIPAWARAKVSMRLVPDQDCEEIAGAAMAHLHSLAPDGVRVTVEKLHTGKAYVAPVDHPIFRAAARAQQRGFGKEPLLIREGGSIPFVPSIQEILGCPCILMGYALPDAHAHAPNERFHLSVYYRGMQALAALYDEMSRL